jgi:putative membrane-bound dehydrogenase-like protein
MIISRIHLFTGKLSFVLMLLLVCISCGKPDEKSVRKIDPVKAAAMAKAVEEVVKPQIADGLALHLWASDSLVADIVSIDVDDDGKLFYTRINRQDNAEFDIRGHQDWEIESIKLQNVEDKRNFLRRVLAPENSDKNTWLEDSNHDGSHDWRDMTVKKEQIFSVSDVSGDGVADETQLVIEDFHEEITDAAGGVLKHGDDLFVAIGPDMWRVNDTNGDGVADKKESISHGYGVHIGFSGHGMSGAEVGPDGRIYWQIGDIGFSGTSADGKKWEHPNSGVIVRANPDGSDFEVFSYGNRNTHEFVFDEYGNLISVDNDGDHPGESERLVYVVNGADLGWRINWQFGKYRDQNNNTYKVWMDEKYYVPHFEGQAGHITPPIVNYVNGPTGMLYNPGTAWGPEWKNTFFVAEFVGNPAQSGIHAFKLKPQGAGFELAETKKIVGGVLATGLDFGPDGAMYVGDWIDGWGAKEYGRIWKLDVSSNPSGERQVVQAILKEHFQDLSNDKLTEYLKNADMRVRQKAQFELATRGDEGLEVFKAAIAQRENQLARVNAIWGIGQLARKKIEHGAVLIPLLKDQDPEIRAQAAKWIGDVKYKDAGNALIPLLKDEYTRARFFAAEALGRISFAPAINPLVELLQSNNDQDMYIRHAASLALARIGDAKALTTLSTHPSAASRLGAVLALRRMRDKGVEAFLKDQDEWVATDAARAINDDLSIAEALPALGEVLNYTTFTNEPLIRRAINANLRVGSEAALSTLIRYAANEHAPAAMRAEALAAVGTWSKPSVLDRVDGRYRGEITRESARVNQVSAGPLFTLTTSKDKFVRLAAVKAIGKMKIDKSFAILSARLKSDSDAEVRREALQSLAAINEGDVGGAIRTALQDKDKEVRVTALDLLPKMQMEKNVMVASLLNVIQTKTVEEKQAAIVTLGTLPAENTKTAFDQLLVQLDNKKLPVEVNLELGDAILATRSAELIKQFKSIIARSSSDTLRASYAGALLGGNPDRGERIFYSHQTAQCIRCHSLGDRGGNAGPRLNGVASRISRQQILEALIDPGARLAPGYGMVSVELSNGRKMSGILQDDQPQYIKLKVGSNPDTTIQSKDIRHRKNAASSMPPMRLLLTKKEIRDVVSFIATLEKE